MKEIISYFLKIGLLGFGGPMAHIGMMDHELVEKRKWVTKDEFLDGIAVCNLLPGPASTQLGIYMGYKKGGLTGGILAGIAFITPAFLIITLLSYIYFRFGTIAQVQGILYGVNAVVIALIGTSLYKMGKKSIDDRVGFLLFISSTVLIYFFELNMILVMILGGIVGYFVYNRNILNKRRKSKVMTLSIPLLFLDHLVTELFIFFFKVGSFIYGGGLVIIPFIQQEVVLKYGWLTQEEFLTGISFGQVTPGPVVITAAFIGFKVANLLGALIATIGIFLPSFIFILVAAPFLAKFKNVPWIKASLKGINATVIGMILASIMNLIPDAIVDYWTFSILVLAIIAIVKYKVNVFYVVGFAGIVGVLLNTWVV